MVLTQGAVARVAGGGGVCDPFDVGGTACPTDRELPSKTTAQTKCMLTRILPSYNTVVTFYLSANFHSFLLKHSYQQIGEGTIRTQDHGYVRSAVHENSVGDDRAECIRARPGVPAELEYGSVTVCPRRHSAVCSGPARVALVEIHKPRCQGGSSPLPTRTRRDRAILEKQEPAVLARRISVGTSTRAYQHVAVNGGGKLRRIGPASGTLECARLNAIVRTTCHVIEIVNRLLMLTGVGIDVERTGAFEVKHDSTGAVAVSGTATTGDARDRIGVQVQSVPQIIQTGLKHRSSVLHLNVVRVIPWSVFIAPVGIRTTIYFVTTSGIGRSTSGTVRRPLHRIEFSSRRRLRRCTVETIGIGFRSARIAPMSG